MEILIDNDPKLRFVSLDGALSKNDVNDACAALFGAKERWYAGDSAERFYDLVLKDNTWRAVRMRKGDYVTLYVTRNPKLDVHKAVETHRLRARLAVAEHLVPGPF